MMRSKRYQWMTALVATVMVFSAAAVAAAIPAGTHLTVRMNSTVSSATARPGDTFDASLSNDVVSGGQTLVKAGAAVRGEVVQAKSSGRIHAPGYLSVRLVSVGGTSVSTTPASFGGKGHMKSNATKIGGGAALGALIGGLAGGGKGAAIGLGAGAAAGTGVAMATGKKEAVIPAEAALTFTVTSSSGSVRSGGRRRTSN